MESRVELRELDFTLDGFLVLASPDNMRGLRRLQSDETVLRHARNVTETPFFSNR